jgi:hypothetical protein
VAGFRWVSGRLIAFGWVVVAVSRIGGCRFRRWSTTATIQLRIIKDQVY